MLDCFFEGGICPFSPYIYFGIELAQMKLDELVEDVMNLDINKKSMDDNRSYS